VTAYNPKKTVKEGGRVGVLRLVFGVEVVKIAKELAVPSAVSGGTGIPDRARPPPKTDIAPSALVRQGPS